MLLPKFNFCQAERLGYDPYWYVTGRKIIICRNVARVSPETYLSEANNPKSFQVKQITNFHFMASQDLLSRGMETVQPKNRKIEHSRTQCSRLRNRKRFKQRASQPNYLRVYTRKCQLSNKTHFTHNTDLRLLSPHIFAHCGLRRSPRPPRNKGQRIHDNHRTQQPSRAALATESGVAALCSGVYDVEDS